jgi:hypothetical protein
MGIGAPVAHPQVSDLRRARTSHKDPIVLYLGDHDASGVDIDRDMQAKLNRFDGAVEFRRVAILPEQIDAFNLPTRPPKKTDSRSKGWEGGCVEIDTLSGQQIRELLEAEIIGLIDPDAWERTQAIEAAERESLNNILERYRDDLEDIA